MENRQFLLGTVACQTVCAVARLGKSYFNSDIAVHCWRSRLKFGFEFAFDRAFLPVLSDTISPARVSPLLTLPGSWKSSRIPRRGTAAWFYCRSLRHESMASFWMPGRWSNQFTYINQRVPLAPVVQLKLWCSGVYGFSRMLPPRDIRAGEEECLWFNQLSTV